MAEASEFGLPPASLLTIRQILAATAAVEHAIIYGSRAMGTHRPGSDIDLTLVGPGLGLPELSRIATALDESDIPYQVDLSILEHIDDAPLKAHIERVGRVFYRREREAAGSSSAGCP